MAIYRGSRYQNTLVYIHVQNGETHPTLVRNKSVPTLRRRTISKINSTEGILYTFQEGDRLDYLAYQFYGDPQLWWVILDNNPKYMTPFDIKPGDLLSIPSYQEVRREYL